MIFRINNSLPKRRIYVLVSAVFGLILTVFVVFNTKHTWALLKSQKEILTCSDLIRSCNLALKDKEAKQPRFEQTIVLGLASKADVVSFSVESRGTLGSDIGEFTTLALETLNDPRGWSKAGLQFSKVESGGDFTLVLASPAEVAAFSVGCDSYYSCSVGRYVIINEDRWNQGTDAWSGSLRDYRHMVINHETGHWLGHGHYHCQEAGTPAPVMQQQSINLESCAPNPWPLDFEIKNTGI